MLGLSKKLISRFASFGLLTNLLVSPVVAQAQVPAAPASATPAIDEEDFVKIGGIHFRVVGVSAKKGSFFGASQDDFAVIPLGMHTKLFGARPSLALMIKPTSPAQMAAAMDQATVALRIARREPRQNVGGH